MSSFDKLLRGHLTEQFLMTHTAILGEITSIDGNKASARPLQRGYPVLTGLPMLEKPNGYNIGDEVLIVFLESARDGVGDRRHSLEDGIIVGVLM